MPAMKAAQGMVSTQAMMMRSPQIQRTERTPLVRSEEHTSELQSQSNIVCRLLLEKKIVSLLSTAAVVEEYVALKDLVKHLYDGSAMKLDAAQPRRWATTAWSEGPKTVIFCRTTPV